jgi:hypothetical protein
MEPLGHGAIRFRHVGDLREHGAFPVRLGRTRAAARFRLQLSGALPHRSSFLVRESSDFLPIAVELLADRCVLFVAGFLSAIAKHPRASNEASHRS